MSPLVLLSTAILAPTVLGVLGLALPRRAIAPRVLLAIAGPAIAVVALAVHAATFGLDRPIDPLLWLPAFELNWDLQTDRLSFFFALLVSGIGLLITIYARAYFGPDADSLYRFFPSLHLFMTAMLGLALADSFMLLLLFWELTSISSFLLIGWDREDPKAVKNAVQAFVVTGAGGLVLMGGLILLGLISGAWSFTQLDALAGEGTMPRGALAVAAFGLIFAGAAAKSAQWPLHFWLPGAMAAPTPVSAYLHSATMVKAGVYLVGRFWPTLAQVVPNWPAVIVTFGCITMVLGSYIALRKSDLKQIFAYTTVSQLGLLMAMYGTAATQYHGEPNLIWDVTQILNHALYKAPLFLIAGAIAHVLHTRELPGLRGMFRRGGEQRLLALIVIFALYAMAAGPLTLSFTAKEFFFYQLWHAYESTHHAAWRVAMGAGVAVAMFNVAIFLRMTLVLLGRPQPTPAPLPGDEGGVHAYHGDEHHHDSPLWLSMLWIPAAVLVALQYISGIVPGAHELLFGGIERSRFYFERFPMTWDVKPGVPLYLSLAGFGLGVMLALLPLLRTTIRDVHDAIYPGFYDLSTRGGGAVFRLLQTGNLRTYIGISSVALVLLVLWSMEFRPIVDPLSMRLPEGATMESPRELMVGYLFTFVVCISAVLMPLVRERASRIIVLGLVGFAVSALFYLYHAPDLALTQISIEIVSLILFLLVLSLLPRTEVGRRRRRFLRLTISIAVGLTMFWLALLGSTGQRPASPYVGTGDERIEMLGEFFIRNSYESVDVPNRKGGGGNNIVNVILVDFRGFDTLGEILVLALAAVGVWTLLRRRPRDRGTHALRRNLSEGTRRVVDNRPDLILQEMQP